MEAVSMEAIRVEGHISGAAAIDDLLNRFGERQLKSCDFREIDSYRGYSGKVQID